MENEDVLHFRRGPETKPIARLRGAEKGV